MQAVIEISKGVRPLRENAKKDISQPLWEIMEDCWQDHPDRRPLAREVLASLEILAPPKRPQNKSLSLPVLPTATTLLPVSKHIRRTASQPVDYAS